EENTGNTRQTLLMSEIGDFFSDEKSEGANDHEGSCDTQQKRKDNLHELIVLFTVLSLGTHYTVHFEAHMREIGIVVHGNHRVQRRQVYFELLKELKREIN
ncbi:hypothetical protein PMAYCL1PPCAC_22767, partial [Pristionchus mayeri]